MNGQRRASSWDKSWPIGKLFALFAWSMFSKQSQSNRQMTYADLDNVPKVDRASRIGRMFAYSFEKNKNTVLLASLSPLKWRLSALVIVQLTNGLLLTPFIAMCIGRTVSDIGQLSSIDHKYMNKTNEKEYHLEYNDQMTLIKFDALGLIVISASIFVLNHWTYMESSHLGMKLRVACSREIYAKSLKLSQASLAHSTSIGQVVNLLSNDMSRFDKFPYQLTHLIRAPLSACVMLFMLSSNYVGFKATFVGILGICSLLVIQAILLKLLGRFRLGTAKQTDERIARVHEIISSIKVVKMYTWEEPLKKLVELARNRELYYLKCTAFVRTCTETLCMSSVRIIGFLVLTTVLLSGRPLEPDILFIVISLITNICYSLSYDMQAAITCLIELVVSCKRIDNFLQLDELKSAADQQSKASSIHDNKQVANNKTNSYSINSNSNSNNIQIYNIDKGIHDLGPSIILKNLTCHWSNHHHHHHHHHHHNNNSTTTTTTTTTQTAKDNIHQAVINNLSLQLASPNLTILLGRVGSGKSSLLLALLRELPISSGSMQVNGRVSYAPQAAWISSASIRDNILFGEPLDQERYDKVLKVCSLNQDLALLPLADLSIIGEQGISLSGGQRARVNLARALYRPADIYLLDDPLSAVDAHVARHIFHMAVKRFLADKLVILATHQMQFARYAKNVLLLRDQGQQAIFSTPDELYASGILIQQQQFLIDLTMLEKSRSESVNSESQLDAQNDRANKQIIDNKLKLLGRYGDQGCGNDDDDDDDDKHEHDQIGNFSTSNVINYYWKTALSVKGLLLMFLLNGINRFVLEYNLYYLSLWAESSHRKLHNPDLKVNQANWTDSYDTSTLLWIFFFITIAIVVTTFVRAAQFFWVLLKGSRRMHTKLFQSLIKAPMSFYDNRSIGTVLNRVSRDTGYLDEILPSVFVDIVAISHQVLGTMALIISIDYGNLFPCVAYIILICFVRRYSIRTIIQLRHLEARARSPVYSHLANSLHGLSLIRSFNVQNKFMLQFERHLDQHSSAWFANLTSGCLAAAMLNVSLLALVWVIILYKIYITLDPTNATLIGLIVIRLFSLPEPMDWAFRQLVEIESQITSVQRIRDYIEIEPEEKMKTITTTTTTTLSKLAPDPFIHRTQTGNIIEFKNVTLRYEAGSEPVLRNLNFAIKSGEKVGVVGRTGAGKSSIIAALFKLYPIDESGSIQINCVDMSTMTLQQLRSQMSIIPQDPVLFADSLRYNLDPWLEHSDLELWHALDIVKLKSTFYGTSAGLEFKLDNSGCNLSLGQRQLLCLARAILRKKNILILDEATANVDPETDSFIQRTIRTQFAHCTVLTIAHRLLTIVDSDRVLVLDAGQVRQFDTPLRLLQDTNGIFDQLISSTDSRTAAKLRAIILSKSKSQ